MKKLVLVLLLVFLVGCSSECTQDSDCFKDVCCHASTCSSIEPDCSMEVCTTECAPDTLDCGGKCVCNNGQCEGVMSDF